MYNELINVLTFLKKEIGLKTQCKKSIMNEFLKPTMMGNDGIYLSIDTHEFGITINFWNTGVFEIWTDLIDLEDADYFVSHVPDGDFNNNHYPEKDVKLLIEKINELIIIINEKYTVQLSKIDV